MSEKRYSQLIHLIAAGIAIALWVISVQFSVDGFGFILPKYRWVGYVLSIAVTVIELVFNEEGMNHTLTIVAVGFLAYLYGIATNVIGIWAAQGNPDLESNPIMLLFPLLLGVFLEITPEPLLVWGLMGTTARDLLGHIFGNMGGGNGNSRSSLGYPANRRNQDDR